MSFIIIRNGRLWMLDKTLRELPDGIRDGCARRAAESARRKEWKTSGEGAKFMGTFEPSYDAASRAKTSSWVMGAAEYNGALYFSERNDEVSGIYKKISPEDDSEAIAVSSNDYIYGAPDIFGDMLAVPVTRGDETHIAISRLPSFDLRTVTEGNTIEADPVWSRTEPDVLYFSSAGLPEDPDMISDQSSMMTPASIMEAMNRQEMAPRGPSSICRLDTKSGEFTTLIEDDRYDFVKPFSAGDGSLYYIKRPYGMVKRRGGCLYDALMLPVRLVRSLFGFLSFFSLKYSGTPLSGGGTKAKRKDEGELFIEGNLINAEKELKANRDEKELAGIIPKSWELHRLTKEGRDELIKCGVRCYTLDDDGRVIFSNGKYLLRMKDDGLEKLSAADGVESIKGTALHPKSNNPC